MVDMSSLLGVISARLKSGEIDHATAASLKQMSNRDAIRALRAMRPNRQRSRGGTAVGMQRAAGSDRLAGYSRADQVTDAQREAILEQAQADYDEIHGPRVGIAFDDEPDVVPIPGGHGFCDYPEPTSGIAEVQEWLQ